MSEQLNEQDYKRFQAFLYGGFHKAREDGADMLSISHALAPFAVEALLKFHDPDTLKFMFARQVDVLAIALEREGADVH